MGPSDGADAVLVPAAESDVGETMSWKPTKSSGYLGWGITLVIIGQVAYDAGQRQSIRAALRSSLWSASDDGSAWTVVGLISSLVGLVLLVSGVVYLAQSVDYLARREHARSMIDSATPTPGTSSPGDDEGASPDQPA